MKKKMNQLISYILCCIFFAGICISAALPITAKADTYISALDAANALYELGLFKGTGTDADGNPVYDLERTPNRHEAVTMLVRLLGKETIAESFSWPFPFTDVAQWAQPYVGYAYQNNITMGTSATTYGGNSDITASQYITFMLRTLGYSSETDFRWDAAWELSDRIGMTSGEYNVSTGTFTRGDMVRISYAALSCEMRDGITLYEYLVLEGAITEKNPDSIDENEGIIETPYLTLYFDNAMSDYLKVVHYEGTPYVLEFNALLENREAQPLFDILFDEETEENLGIIDTNLGEVPVGIVIHPFEPDNTWSRDEINTIHAMQEVLNQLIDQLMEYQVEYTDEKPDKSSDEPDNPSDKDDFDDLYEEPEYDLPNNTKIVTPFCTLYFPEEWRNYLLVDYLESENYTVKFSAVVEEEDPVALFSLIFGGDDGEQLGVIKTSQNEYVTVNLVMEDLGDNVHSDDIMSILCEMQEAVNVLIPQFTLE